MLLPVLYDLVGPMSFSISDILRKAGFTSADPFPTDLAGEFDSIITSQKNVTMNDCFFRRAWPDMFGGLGETGGRTSIDTEQVRNGSFEADR
jgi:hypothetical protein